MSNENAKPYTMEDVERAHTISGLLFPRVRATVEALEKAEARVAELEAALRGVRGLLLLQNLQLALDVTRTALEAKP